MTQAVLLWRRTVRAQELQEWLAEKLHVQIVANVSQQLRCLEGKRAVKVVTEVLKEYMRDADDLES